MKKFFLFLIISLIPLEVFADEDYKREGDLGILREFIEEDFSEDLKPKISNRMIAEAAFDDNYQATNRRNEFKESQGKVRFYSKLNLNNKWAINSYLKAERLDNASEAQRRNRASTGGGDRAFENVGIFMEELNLSYDHKKYAFIAGKFNLNFGTAWRWDRGLWIREIADNYSEREKLGVSGILHLGDRKKTGQYNFGLTAFTNDRKNLDNSILVNRDSNHKNQGTPGDTRTPQSYVASLDINFDFGEKFGKEEKLSYHFSYINLAVNEKASPLNSTKVDDQKGYALGMNYKYPYAENLLLDGLIEFSEVKNFGGNAYLHNRYLTTNLISKVYNNYLITLGFANRQSFEFGANGFDQNMSEISFGYEFDKNDFFDKLILQAGYKNQRINYKTSVETQNALGVLVRYYKNF